MWKKLMQFWYKIFKMDRDSFGSCCPPPEKKKRGRKKKVDSVDERGKEDVRIIQSKTGRKITSRKRKI